MYRISYLFFVLSLILVIGCSHNKHPNQQKSLYDGQETREIKALSTQEVEGYLTGKGMGLSKVAELNQYPGPKHVLELAGQLKLSDQQIEQTKGLFNQMRKEAVNIGKSYIAKERKLNEMFESGSVSSSTVDSMLVEIGRVKGRLRATHVSTHIKMEGILSSGQVKKYDELRGYGNNNPSSHHQKHL